MAGLALKRYQCGNVINHHLSLVCPTTRSVFAKIELPFGVHESVFAGRCHALVYLHSREGKIIIINLGTQEMIVPPMPMFKRSHMGVLIASGLGYIAESKEYKLVRIYNQYDEDESSMYAGSKSYCELYSIKNGLWKKIKPPGAYLTSHTGVYINDTKCCYWIASLGHTFGAIAEEPCLDHVMCFNFTTETFGNAFSLPAFTVGEDVDAIYELVECHGSLGVLVYMIRDGPFSIKLFELVEHEMCWKQLYDVALDHVPIQGPVGLDDGRFLFLEARHSRDISKLLVYDLVSAELKELGIYDGSGHMSAISYVPSQYPLPQSEPISMVRYVETTVPPLDSEPISSDNKEERKTSETGRMLNKGPRMKIKRGSKRTKTKTVSKNKPRSPKCPQLTTFICESSQQQ